MVIQGTVLISVSASAWEAACYIWGGDISASTLGVMREQWLAWSLVGWKHHKAHILFLGEHTFLFPLMSALVQSETTME